MYCILVVMLNDGYNIAVVFMQFSFIFQSFVIIDLLNMINEILFSQHFHQVGSYFPEVSKVIYTPPLIYKNMSVCLSVCRMN